MIYPHPQSKEPVMKHANVILLLSIAFVIVATLVLPWYTEVISVNNIFISVSKAGVETAASLPAVVPLGLVLLAILFKRGNKLNAAMRKIIFTVGVIVILYAGYYFCGKAMDLYVTPGFGALLAIVGGFLLVIIYVLNSGE